MTKSKGQPIPKKQSARFAVEIALWCICFLLGIRYADQIKYSMLQTLTFCIRTVIPALFPYMILSSLLMKILTPKDNEALRTRQKKRAYLSPSLLCAITSGVLCGFPIGAQTTIDLYNQRKIKKSEAQRLFPLCNQCSLSFVVLGIGKGLLDSIRIGFFLYIIMILSAMLVYILMPSKSKTGADFSEEKEKSASRPFIFIIRDATLSTLYTVGLLLFFSIPIALIEAIITNRVLQLILTIPLEFTGACRMAISVLTPASRFLLPILSLILSFGGICVGMQSELIVRDGMLSMSEYYKRKLLQGAIAFCISFLGATFILHR